MDIFKELIKDGYTILSNEGCWYTTDFIPRETRKINFFWFHDAYYSHSTLTVNSRYLHILIKKLDDYNFYSMENNKKWEDYYNHHLIVKKKHLERKLNGEKVGNLMYNNPPIIRLDAPIQPDLIFDFEEDGNKEAVCIFPEKYKGMRCTFFDDNHYPIDFIEIPELIKTIREIVKIS